MMQALYVVSLPCLLSNASSIAAVGVGCSYRALTRKRTSSLSVHGMLHKARCRIRSSCDTLVFAFGVVAAASVRDRFCGRELVFQSLSGQISSDYPYTNCLAGMAGFGGYVAEPAARPGQTHGQRRARHQPCTYALGTGIAPKYQPNHTSTRCVH